MIVYAQGPNHPPNVWGVVWSLRAMSCGDNSRQNLNGNVFPCAPVSRLRMFLCVSCCRLKLTDTNASSPRCSVSKPEQLEARLLGGPTDCNLICNINCCKMSSITVLHVLPPTNQTCLVKNEVVAGCKELINEQFYCFATKSIKVSRFINPCKLLQQVKYVPCMA